MRGPPPPAIFSDDYPFTLSRRFVCRTFLNLSSDDIQENERIWLEENGNAPFLERESDGSFTLHLPRDSRGVLLPRSQEVFDWLMEHGRTLDLTLQMMADTKLWVYIPIHEIDALHFKMKWS